MEDYSDLRAQWCECCGMMFITNVDSPRCQACRVDERTGGGNDYVCCHLEELFAAFPLQNSKGVSGDGTA